MDNTTSGVNMFIEPIFDKKKKHDFKSWIKLMKLKKKIKSTSPDFNMLMEIYDFLNTLRNVYMYTNDENHNLFLAIVPRDYDAAMIYKEDNFEIKYILKESDKLIGIQINRYGRVNAKDNKEEIMFHDNEAIINNIYDEQKFIFIISCLMDSVYELVEYYYRNKRF